MKIKNLKSIALVLLCTVLNINYAWADYTVLFDADASGEQTTLAGIVSTGSSYVSSVTASKTYMEDDGLRYGAKSSMGYTTFTMAASGQIKATKITFKDAKYYSTDNSSLAYKITYTDDTYTDGTVTLTSSAEDKEVSLISTKTIKTIDIRKTDDSKVRFYCKGFTVTAAGGGSDPVVAATSSMTAFGYTSGSPVAQSFSVEGSNLTANVTVTAPSNYQVSLDGSVWSTSGGSKTITASGTLSATTVYVRLAPGLAAASSYAGNITVASTGASDATVAVSGSVPYTITWSANETTHATTYVAVGGTLVLPSNPDPEEYVCDDKAFTGWYTAAYSDPDDAPSYVTSSTAPSANTTYYAVFADAAGGEPEEHAGPSFTRDGTSNTCTSGYTFSFAAEAKDGYYQDGSGTLRSLSLYHTSSAIFSTTPSKVTVTAKIGGGTGNKDLDNPVEAQLLNSAGEPIGNATTITSHITTASGDTYSNIELDLTGITSAYGLRISHTKETGYNVRYYSFSMKYFTGGVTYSNYNTSCASCDYKVNISKGDESNGTFTLSKTGEQPTCNGGRVISVTPTPAEHYRVASVTANNPTGAGSQGTATVTGPVNGSYTVTYSNEAKGNSTINVTFEAIPQHTISLSPATPAHGTTSLEAPGTTSVTIYEGTVVNIRAIPDACYELSDITITPESGYSELEQVDDDDYQILGITNNLTVAVTYAQRTQYTVTLDACTGTVSSTSLTQSDCGSVDLPSAAPSDACEAEGWSFAGWSRTKVNGETNTPPVLIPAGSFTPTASETLYAVYKQSVSGGATYWVRVYDDTKLSVNDSVIIADNEGNNYAMANQCNTNYRCEAEIGRASVNGDTLTSINASVVKFILQSGKSSGTYAFYDPTASGYLCAQSAAQNYLKTQTTLDDYGSWNIDINSISGNAAIEAATMEATRKMMLHNNSSTRFSCYTSDGAQTQLICLYAKAMGSANVYNSIPSCLPCVSSEASLSSSALSLSTGKTSVVTLTSANTSAVSATSADPTIATVSVVGKELTINGLKEGETTITVEQDRDDPGESGHCEVYFELVVSVTTSTIEIIEWEREAVIIEYDGDADASVVLGKEVEHGSKTGSVATELFFSKYFEAAGTDKLFGIFNGTEKTIDLTDYFVWVKGFGTTLSLASYGATAGEIAPKEEIIFYTYGSTKYSKECMDTVPGHEKWNEISWEGMQFSGRHSIGLYRKDKSGNDSIIDIIGATVYDKANPNDYDPDLVILNKATGTGSNVNGIIPSWGDESGFNAEGCGDNIMTKNDVETAYGLSTNRCLLVRKNTVTSGANAVARDTTSFNPNDDPDICAAAFQTLCSEWSGYHVVGQSSAGKQNTCEGMSEVAKFNYSNYYVTMETFSDDTEIGSYSLGDGTYRIPLPDLDTLACRLLRIQLAKDGEVIASSDPKVPIVVDANMSTNSEEFYKHSIDTCKVCDVVVRDNATLTKAANGAANDRAELRNITVYSGSHLIIPSGATNMKATSIVLRSLDDTISTASFEGGVQFKDAGYRAYHSKRVKEDRWYWFCLPHACRTNRITWQDGSLARLGTDFHLKYYDGEQRAATQSGGCWKEYTGSTIQPGVGYILSVEKREGHTYRELIFPMDTISEGETTKPVSVDDYGAGEDITPNHKGWNLVGNPYMTYYQKNTINAGDKNLPALTVGKLNRIRVDDPEEPTKHLLTYEILTDGVNGAPFVTVPVSNGNSEYTQVLLMDYDLPPFISYFVQIGDDAAPSSDPLYVNFAKADLTNDTTRLLKASYVRKRIQEEEDALEPILVTLHMQNGKNESDETTLIISDLYSNEYEIGSDLGKMFGDEYKSHSKPVFYSKMEDNTKLAFRSMPDSAANEWTPLGFWGYNTQPITVSLRRNNRKLDYVESVMLYDKTMNTYTELLTDDYVLYPTKQGLFGSRLSVKVKVKRPSPAIATGMDEAHEGLYAYAAGNQQLVVAGIPEHATVWLYDALGKLIAMENTSHYMRTYTLPSSGVYFVRVNNEQGQRILRVIIK